jgi:hypothetical protein
MKGVPVEHQATLSLAPVDDGGLIVDMARDDVAAAFESARGGQAELLLELEAREADGGASRHTITLDCTAADLERLLAGTDDRVLLRFDPEGLGQAIDTDEVEAHGLREKMAVVAMVVATTGAAAGTAQAMPVLGNHGSHAAGAVAASSAAAAAASGAQAPRADPAQAAEATLAQSDSEWGGQASTGQLGPYSGGAPFQEQRRDGQLGPYSGGAPFQGAQTETPVRGGAVASDQSSPIDSTTIVIAGGIALTLIGAAFGAAAANRRNPTPT